MASLWKLKVPKMPCSFEKNYLTTKEIQKDIFGLSSEHRSYAHMVCLGLGLTRLELAWSQYSFDSQVSAETVIYEACTVLYCAVLY